LQSKFLYEASISRDNSDAYLKYAKFQICIGQNKIQRQELTLNYLEFQIYIDITGFPMQEITFNLNVRIHIQICLEFLARGLRNHKDLNLIIKILISKFF